MHYAADVESSAGGVAPFEVGGIPSVVDGASMALPICGVEPSKTIHL